ncbi:MAG: UbiD family decarboxylase [Methanothrix sp.]|uniref:UbiD family decarboxylase n=1 Tax=Methanothrix sp. TaxID=90426 RepID=UPI0032AE9ED4|nr:UbiD family decarboxylase [Methanothrix sp.]
MSLRSFLEDLRSGGVLEEIHEHVSTEYELAMRASGRGPMLFHNADGHMCCINILGSRELLARALRMDARNLARDLSAVGYEGRVREVNSSQFQENILEPDLSQLPVLRHFRGDGGRYITSGVVVSRLDERINACVHRLMVLDERRLAARLVPGRHTHQMYSRAIEAGRRLPVAIAIGVDPVVLIAASTRVPESKEFEYASALRGDVVEVVTLGNGVPVPHAEIVLEGYLTEKRAPEGPFVDITGTMDLVREEPVIEITRMMMRDDAIYHALLPAGGEHRMLMGVPYEPLIYREASKVVSVKNVLLTEGGCTYFHAVVQIDKRDEGDGLKAIKAAMAAHGSLKHVLVVDTDIDIHDPRDLEYAIATRVRGDQDIYVYPNVRGSTLDPRSVDGITTKVGVDATAKLDRLWKFRRVARPW